MKLNNTEINKFTTEILSLVENRLDAILEVAILNEEFITFYSDWVSQLGFNQDDEEGLGIDEEKYMKQVWNAAGGIKKKFPLLGTTQEIRDFARLDI